MSHIIDIVKPQVYVDTVKPQVYVIDAMKIHFTKPPVITGSWLFGSGTIILFGSGVEIQL